VLKFNLKKQTNLKNCNLNILISREFFDIDNQFNRQRMSKIRIALKEKRGEKIMFYFDNFVVSLPIRPIVYRRCSPQSFEICLREKSRSPHTHTPVSLSGLSVFLCVCLSMEPSLSPFEPEKRENGGDERESSWQRRPQVLSVSQVGHGRRRRRREEAVHDGLSPPPTTTVRLLRN
jgi:hypothetical protein